MDRSYSYFRSGSRRDRGERRQLPAPIPESARRLRWPLPEPTLLPQPSLFVQVGDGWYVLDPYRSRLGPFSRLEAAILGWMDRPRQIARLSGRVDTGNGRA